MTSAGVVLDKDYGSFNAACMSLLNQTAKVKIKSEEYNDKINNKVDK
jgi:hypothetical protein